ncbi:MAG: ribosome-associated translation inhibitor RaiA, partial [Actinobacteria bacterium]|nr:ribosome-associated translation inhibitor RaiA [Actinomycetota bacterium]
GERHVEVVVRGRNVEVPAHFRQHVAEKLARVERYDQKISRTDVELYHEKNRRQNGSCQHIEITCRTRGPVIRAEACAADFYQALDLVVDKLERRIRTAADRRRIHHGRRTPTSLASATSNGTGPDAAGDTLLEEREDYAEDGPGRIVREKEHPGKPMTVDQALFEMELVGHDFYLFADMDSGRPSVVYRRHAYDYGIIRLTD